MTTSTSEPGTRLGGRYRLEDRIAAGGGWAAWKAMDETLARAVTVLTFAPGFPRVDDVVSAARAASRLNDPRLAQVFDVEDARDQAYIVLEWASGESLVDLLAEGPLEPSRAARMIAEAAAALSAAHAAGVAHMCLSPGSLRRSYTGEVKIVGLGIDAALSACSSDDPVLADTQGLGYLLYAALTGHWPGSDYAALPPAPVSGGVPCSPRQVMAGVPAALSEICCRAMQLRTKGHGADVHNPEQLARALLAASAPEPLPPAEPPAGYRGQSAADRAGGNGYDLHWDARDWPGRAEDTYSDSPGYDSAGYDWDEAAGHAAGSGLRRGGRGAGRGAGPTARGSGPGGRAFGPESRAAGPGRDEPRARPAVIVIVVAVLLTVAVVAVLVSRHIVPVPGFTSKPTPTSSATHSASPAAAASVLTPAGASGFDPLTSVANDPQNENTPDAPKAIDNSPGTAWTTQWYNTASFGNLKTGSGLIVDMGNSVGFRTVMVDFGPRAGADVQIRVGDSNALSAANLNSMKVAATASNVSGSRRFTFRATGRYLVIWFTKLAPGFGPAGSKFAGQVSNIIIRGTR